MFLAAIVNASGLAGALIASGGGAGSYSTIRAFTSMIGAEAVQNELSTIRERSTPMTRDTFVHEFDFAISDAWIRAGRDDVKIPDSGQRGLPLAKALYAYGLQGGAFSGKAFLNSLFTVRVWSAVARDVNAKFGPGASATFEGNVGAMFSDLEPQLRY
jgi:hypothetical protein